MTVVESVSAPSVGQRVPTVGFVMEQTLGHVTHAANLRSLLSAEEAIVPRFRDVDWDVTGPAARLPLYRSNWTVRAGLQARGAIAGLHREGPLDALFIHTQVPAVLCRDWLRRVPTIVSVDATPRQYDQLGASYGHAESGAALELLKWRLNRSAFQDAAHLVAWSQWAKDGLVADYDVDPDRVSVIPPGVDVASWRPPIGAAPSGPVRILFVGGDLERKGGTELLAAFRALRQRAAEGSAAAQAELHLVTRTPVAPEPGVSVHSGLQPNSHELKDLFARADVFCLPTHGDCLPMVLSEAGAMRLPLVATDVGAVSEIVRDGETGTIVRPGDVPALTRALETLVAQPGLRQRLGARAAEVVAQDFDAGTNARRLVELLAEVAERPASEGRWRRARPRPQGATRLETDGNDVLLTVSGMIPDDVRAGTPSGRPTPDYVAMAEAFGADLADLADARRATGRLGAVIERIAGPHAVLAWHCFRTRGRYRVVFTDGEQVGLPYALLTRLARRRPRHVMIAHIMSTTPKVALYRLAGLGSRIDTFVVYATAQQRFLLERLGVPAERVALTHFMVDSAFFAPTSVTPRRMICSAGLEGRDYETLVEAVRGVDVEVVLAAASPWSRRADATQGADLPDNVTTCRLDHARLRDLYADSAFVVVPLHDLPFQAGVTTILEAMAMGKAVVCTRTTGQTDVVVDGVTGLYVPPADPVALRKAIERLLGDAVLARRLGEAGRRRVEQEMDVRVYAARLAGLVDARREG